jgi:transcriptional regulator with XRE-family HTH domain
MGTRHIRKRRVQMKKQLKQHPSYLVRERKKWGLSQEELGILLGMTKSAVCRFETQGFKPSFDLVLATQIVFDLSLREAFPESFASVHEEVVRRAAKLDADGAGFFVSDRSMATRSGQPLLLGIVESPFAPHTRTPKQGPEGSVRITRPRQGTGRPKGECR